MDRKDIVTFLKSFVKQQKSEVNYGTYRETSRSSLLKEGLGTRANSVWKQSQFVVAYGSDGNDENNEDINAYLAGWKELTRGIYDQYLILECPDSVWNVFDKNCNKIGLEDLKLAPQKQGTGKSFSLVKSANLIKAEHLSFLTAIRTKPFILLAGISGTGKSRIVRKLAQATDTIDKFKNEEERWACHRPKNFELIQVKPNWHNSMDVVGFYSNVSGAYSFTPFVEFVVKAWRHKDVPFFLCLDEMNLAPVEEYFAEYLSAVESRSTDGEGNYWTDPIIKPFKDFGDGVSSKMIVHLLGDTPDNDLAKQFNDKGLTLPPNLIVMGTVNMDETTFSFSRKVLDRAMSIEMNEVDYDAFLSGETENDMPVLDSQNDLLVNRPINALDVKDEVDSGRIIEYLKAINHELGSTPFKLGYRAANEAILYVAAAKAWGSDDIEASLDEFTLMKILSRIEGDESKLMADDDHTILEKLREVITAHLGEGEWKSVRKIDEMSAVLRRDHFVSYWS